VLTVAASTSVNTHAFYSNWGREIDVCAPSNDYRPNSWLCEMHFVGSRLRLRVPWSRKFAPRDLDPRLRRCKALLKTKTGYRTDFGGTSAATALVAGAAALLSSITSYSFLASSKSMFTLAASATALGIGIFEDEAGGDFLQRGHFSSIKCL
jgi:subtilisin family serine protease